MKNKEIYARIWVNNKVNRKTMTAQQHYENWFRRYYMDLIKESEYEKFCQYWGV